MRNKADHRDIVAPPPEKQQETISYMEDGLVIGVVETPVCPRPLRRGRLLLFLLGGGAGGIRGGQGPWAPLFIQLDL